MAIRACRFYVPALCASLVIAPAARAQDPPEQEHLRLRERVTVTAERDEVALDETGSAVTVLTADELRTLGVHWVSDALATVPGVVVARTAGPGGVTSVFLRGANSNHTLVLIDGVKANSPATGSFDFASLPASAVERIEIVRGPQSVLYGSEAIGGVINVITRQGGGAARLSASFNGGSFGTTRATAGVEGGSGSMRYAASFEHFDNDGFSAADDAEGNTEADGFRNTTATGRIAVGGSDGFGFEAAASYFDGRVAIDGYDFSAGPIDDPERLQDMSQLLGSTAVSYRGGIYRGRVRASLTDSTIDSANPPANASSRLDADIVEIDFQNDLDLDASNTTTVGVQYRRESAVSASNSDLGSSGFDESVDTAGVYAKHRVTVADRLNLSGGLRYSDNSQFGSKVTYRATAAWLSSAGVRAHGSIGTGFRAPSLNDLYYPGFSNPELAPEESFGWDLGVGGSFAHGRLDVDATWFHNDVDNLIQYRFPAGVVNVGETRAEGLELGAGWQALEFVRLDATFTYTRAEDLATGEPLLRRPKHAAWAAVTASPAKSLRLLAEVRHKGVRTDFGLVDVIELPGYTVVNLAAQVGVYRSLEIIGRLDNLFDRAYQEVWGYGTPGLSGYVGLRYDGTLR